MFPPLVGRYCNYLLPKLVGGTPQIKVNQTEVRQQMCHPVVGLSSHSHRITYIYSAIHPLVIHVFFMFHLCKVARACLGSR